MVQEAIGLNIKDQIKTMPDQTAMTDMADWLPGLTGGGTKAFKIMRAFKLRCSLYHLVYIQRIVNMGHLLMQQGWAYGVIVDNITITAGLGLKARMKILIHFFDPLDRNIFRKLAVTATWPAMKRAYCTAIKMRNQICGMYSGICATRTMQSDRFIGDFREYFFNSFLHTSYARLLRLPPPIVGSRKLNPDCKTLHIDLKP